MKSKFNVGDHVLFEHQSLPYVTAPFISNLNLIKTGRIIEVTTVDEWKKDVKKMIGLFGSKDSMAGAARNNTFQGAVRKRSNKELDEFLERATPFLNSATDFMYKVAFDEPIHNTVLDETIVHGWYIERSLRSSKDINILLLKKRKRQKEAETKSLVNKFFDWFKQRF